MSERGKVGDVRRVVITPKMLEIRGHMLAAWEAMEKNVPLTERALAKRLCDVWWATNKEWLAVAREAQGGPARRTSYSRTEDT
jgi:hypothetical protein